MTIHLRKYDSNLEHITNKHAFVYYGNETLAKLPMTAIDGFPKSQAVYSCTTTEPKQLEYEYVTWEDSDTVNSNYYFSDREGNIID